MISFYLEAVRVNNGQFIELRAFNGTPEGAKHPLGALNFTPQEWETFRPVLVAAMHWAGHARIPMALRDQTRIWDSKGGDLKIVH